MTERVEEWARWRPAAALRPYVAFFSGYRQRGMPPATHRGLPSPWLTVIVTLDEPLHVAEHPDPVQPGGVFQTLVGGLHTRPATIVTDGAQSGLQLGLSPLGARALLGAPAGVLANADVPGDAVLGAFAHRVQDAVRSRSTWTERFVAVEALLLRRFADARARGGTAPPPAVRPEVGHAWTAILRSGGALRVDRLASEVGWSERHLREVFVREIGLSPKEAARVVRFDVARRRYQSAVVAGLEPSLADVAVQAGYYDQSHLDRDFRRFAGVPPTRWLAEELRNVQVPPSDGASAWPA